MDSFSNSEGARIVADLMAAIRKNAQLLSDIDGAIGDGDHGVNMNKGFTLAGEELARSPGNLAQGLKVVSRTLMNSIGGAMGPLYGMFFRGLAKGCDGKERIDAKVFGEMLGAVDAAMRTLTQAGVGDKTLMDAFLPAADAYRRASSEGRGFAECLESMAEAAERGRDSTRDLVAKVGRASRLGERSRGTQDAGATSCALLLRTMADSITDLIQRSQRG
jgi:dihydroxyacetone kinase-like protein